MVQKIPAHGTPADLGLQGTQRPTHQHLDGSSSVIFEHLAHRLARINLLIAKRNQGQLGVRCRCRADRGRALHIDVQHHQFAGGKRRIHFGAWRAVAAAPEHHRVLQERIGIHHAREFGLADEAVVHALALTVAPFTARATLVGARDALARGDYATVEPQLRGLRPAERAAGGAVKISS